MKTILIFKNNELINEMTESEWIYSRNDDRHAALADGSRDLETDVADWNHEMRCSNRTELRAEVQS